MVQCLGRRGMTFSQISWIVGSVGTCDLVLGITFCLLTVFTGLRMPPYIYLLTFPIHRRVTHNINVPYPVDRAQSAEILVLVVASAFESLLKQVTSSTPSKFIMRSPRQKEPGLKRKAPLRAFGAMRQWSDVEIYTRKFLSLGPQASQMRLSERPREGQSLGKQNGKAAAPGQPSDLLKHALTWFSEGGQPGLISPTARTQHEFPQQSRSEACTLISLLPS